MCEYERSVFLASLAPCGTEGAIAVARARAQREKEILSSPSSLLSRKTGKKLARARAREQNQKTAQ